MASIAEWSITFELAKSIITSFVSFFISNNSLNFEIEAKNNGQSSS